MKLTIRDLLDRQLIDKGTFQPNFAPFHVSTVLREIIAMMQAQAKPKGIKINFIEDQVTPQFRNHETDEMRLQQVVMNLLSNAVKFSEEKSEIEVTLDTLGGDDDNDTLKIRVRDYGIGMTSSELKKVFTANFVGKSPASKKMNP